MFRLNRLTDYGVVVMTDMANRPNQVRNATEISESLGLPLPTVAKLLNALARDGLVSSQRGAAGGYSLGRPAEEITMAAIIQALEGPIALTACVNGSDEHCAVESLCPISGNWNRVNLAIRQALEGVTLTEMAQPAFPAFDAAPRKAAAGA